MLAAIKQLGIFTFFFTLSAADLRWHDTIQAIARQQNENITDQQIDEMSWEEKCTRLKSNPITAARHFQFRLDTLLNQLILADCRPLGTIEHFFYRIEFQQRGSPHAHGVLWVKNSPDPSKATNNDIITFHDKYIQCSLPSEEEDPELYNLVTQLQRHTHSAACRKTSKFCRFNYPRPMADRTIISKPFQSEDPDKSQEQETAERKQLQRHY